MTAAEWWALAAAIAAGLAALADLASARVSTEPDRPALPFARLARLLGHVAVGLIAVALLVAL